MTSISATESDRRRLTASIKQSLRALSIQLSLLNHQVGARAGLNDVDLDCLDLIARHGPISPSSLAQRAALSAIRPTGGPCGCGPCATGAPSWCGSMRG